MLCTHCHQPLTDPDPIGPVFLCDPCYTAFDLARCLADAEPLDQATFTRALVLVLGEEE